MNTERFIARQRKGVNVVFAMLVILLSIMWSATLCDWVFKLGWGWDRQILLGAPLMMVFAIILRFFCLAIFRFTANILNDR